MTLSLVMPLHDFLYMRAVRIDYFLLQGAVHCALLCLFPVLKSEVELVRTFRDPNFLQEVVEPRLGRWDSDILTRLDGIEILCQSSIQLLDLLLHMRLRLNLQRLVLLDQNQITVSELALDVSC